jgi:hypothetical protein
MKTLTMQVSAQRCFQFEQWATEVVNVVREGGGRGAEAALIPL